MSSPSSPSSINNSSPSPFCGAETRAWVGDAPFFMADFSTIYAQTIDHLKAQGILSAGFHLTADEFKDTLRKSVRKWKRALGTYLSYLENHSSFIGEALRRSPQRIGLFDKYNPLNIPRFSDYIGGHDMYTILTESNLGDIGENLYTQTRMCQFTEQLHRLFHFLQKKYTSFRNVQIIPDLLFLGDYPLTSIPLNVLRADTNLQTYLTPFRDAFRTAVQTNPTFVYVPFGMTTGNTNHHMVLIFQPNKKRIQLFDSNGHDFWKPYLPYLNKYIETLLALLDMPHYSFEDIRNTCPQLGMQYYESLLPFAVYEPLGYCVVWSWFFLDFMVFHNEQHAVRDLFDVLRHEISEGQPLSDAQYGEHLRRFIRDYYIAIVEIEEEEQRRQHQFRPRRRVPYIKGSPFIRNSPSP